ncbi:MAG TPA: hypothetical protein VKF17_16785 [Isosphaeraceae bacterium]|nr:hypothetical protein [Isosphaeraceae bacterium]
MTRQELIEKRDQLLDRLSKIQGSTVYKLVECKAERAKLNAELDEIEIALEELAD